MDYDLKHLYTSRTADHVSQILSFHGKWFEGEREREVPSKPWAWRCRRWDPVRKPKHEPPDPYERDDRLKNPPNSTSRRRVKDTDREIGEWERERLLPGQECWYRSKVLEAASLIRLLSTSSAAKNPNPPIRSNLPTISDSRGVVLRHNSVSLCLCLCLLTKVTTGLSMGLN